MKKISYAIIGLISVSALAQTKQVAFTQKLNYKVESENPTYNHISYNFYIGKDKTESLLSMYSDDDFGYEYNIFFKDKWAVPVSITGISQVVSYSPYTFSKILFNNLSVSKIDRKGNFNGLDCQYYGLFENQEETENPEVCFCVDEDNEINNAESLLSRNDIRGLILAVEDFKDEDFRIVYQSAEDTNFTLNLDVDMLLADIEEQQDKSDNSSALSSAVETEDFQHVEPKSEYEKTNTVYDDPLYKYSYGEFENYDLEAYLTGINSIMFGLLYKTPEYIEYGEAKFTREQALDFYEKESESLVKNLSSANIISSDDKKVMKDYFKKQIEKAREYDPKVVKQNEIIEEVTDDESVAYAVTDEFITDYYRAYTSDYKNLDNTEVLLAYDILGDEKLKKNAPDYCEDLLNKIPDFQHTDLKNYVYNLVGQICDLYLYANGGSVAYFETIDSMRKSMLDIEKTREKLSDNDKKLLVEFLKNLD